MLLIRASSRTTAELGRNYNKRRPLRASREPPVDNLLSTLYFLARSLAVPPVPQRHCFCIKMAESMVFPQRKRPIRHILPRAKLPFLFNKNGHPQGVSVRRSTSSYLRLRAALSTATTSSDSSGRQTRDVIGEDNCLPS
jgi:hypothetical protein